MSIEVLADRRLLRSPHRSERFLLVTLEAPVAPADAARPPANVALALDRSGSMRGAKLRNARDAAAHAVRLLQPGDRFSIVAFDSNVEVLVPTSPVTPAAREQALAELARLDSRGCTNLSGGWLLGCQQIAERLTGDAVGRCLLLTDGEANEGITDETELAHHASELRQRGIATSTFGLGEEFNEQLLQKMAEAGGGNFHFIESELAIPRVIGMEIGETLQTVARGAWLEILAPGIGVESLNDFPLHHGPDGVRVDLGSLVSGQLVEAVIKLRFPPGEPGSEHRVDVRAGDLDEALDTRSVALTFRHATAPEVDSEPREQRVDRAVATLFAARARRDALALNRQGRYGEADALVQRCMDRIAAYAGEDEALKRTLSGLARSRQELASHMGSFSRKRVHADSIGSLKGRSAVGASRRRARGEGLGVWVTGPAQLGPGNAAVAALGELLGDTVGGLRVGLLDEMAAYLGPAGNTGLLDTPSELLLVEQVATLDRRSAVRLVVVESALADNWNSHWHPHRATAVASLHAVRSAAALEAAFLACELLLHAPAILSPQYDLAALLHEESRGCLYDLCADSARLGDKLRALAICPSCAATVEALGVSPRLLAEGCAIVSTLASNALPPGR
jgi:Ca-activated chloride channel family protein